MEDLLDNFSKHVNKIISPKLGSKIRNLSRAQINYRSEEDFARLEMNIQGLIESYLSNMKDNDYKEIANNIFNSFVEEDDKNLIKAINFYKSTYEHYQQMNLRRKFHKWRKTSLKLKMINNLLLKENFTKSQNIKEINPINLNNSKILKYENNKMKEKNNLIKYPIIKEKNYSNFNNNIKLDAYEINSYNDIMDDNIENYIKIKKNNIENYDYNYENSDNDKEYKEEYSEELDFNKLYSKKNYI